MAFADPLHPMKRFPRAPWASRRVETSHRIDMSHVRTGSDLEKIEISSMLRIYELNAQCQHRDLHSRQWLAGTLIPTWTVTQVMNGPAGVDIKWKGIAARSLRWSF
jgi:hypothetical protein